jgi:signal transduction histidine kinase
MFVLFLSITYLIAQFFIKRKFNRQMKQMESEQMLLAERNRISADLHDEIGAEVSNIVILSRIAQAKIKNQDSPGASIDKIDRAANDMINKMNGIIWSLNPANDDLVNLVEYLKRYGNDYYEMFGYNGCVDVVGQVRHAQVKGIVRRNAFLILKEALHNIHKHAKATEVKIKIMVESKRLIIEIIDNGVGFDPSQSKRGCLGLSSIRRRAVDVNGEVEINPIVGTGTTVRASFALEHVA